MKDNPNFSQQYRCELTLTQPRCVVSITGNHPADVQNTITQLLKGKTRFDAGSNPNTVLVFNDQHYDGEQPIGWIAQYEVPTALGVGVMAEHRIALVQKAA